MNIDWKIVAMGLGIALVIEGLPYFLLADKMPEVLRALASTKTRTLRIMGLCAMLAGVTLVWLMKR
ncbi:DUF2065 domain-containing protein [Fundidesulfovibrio soli]|uniref:DUF2065 domain-containing protein n=1 Tax=Fundidesulfovibrio soli TaxID=2922716 RepID=UPI001FAED8DC|nr:DUF2065 domain-containing protein [Fundidesulfovibrio soli]